MELIDLTKAFTDTPFQRFQEVIGGGGKVLGLVATGGAVLSGKASDALTDMAREFGAKGLVTVRVAEKELLSPMAKHLGEASLHQAISQAQAHPGDLVLMVADSLEASARVLGALRVHLAEQLKIVPEDRFAFAWVTDFPLFHYNEQTRRWESEHHPFTAAREEDLAFLEKEPGRVRSRSYDLVVNGVELGSGSIRIHRRDVQEAIFRVLGLPPEEVKERFGFLLDAFRFGAPPHGGIAPGIDRLMALITKAPSIREVVAFPKTQKAVDLMTNAPSDVKEEQLKEAGIRLRR